MREILVGRDHEGVEISVFLSLMSDCADDVISFESVHFNDRNAESSAQFFHFGDRGGQFFGHCLPLGLVFGISFMTGSRGRGIEGYRKMSGRFLPDNGEEGVGETIYRRGVYTI